ncbi:aldehyde dehydrogenase [Ramaria rubella]|nr:aldehyde dehydrogenase [Ramaria rubella]
MSSSLVYTPVGEIEQIRDTLRASFRAGKTKSIAFRKEQLLQLAYLFQDNIERFHDSLKKDLGRPVLETNLLDVSAIIGEALFVYKNVDKWVKPEKAPFDVTWFPFSPTIRKAPKGTVLIVTPFNYPLWCLTPIAGAIAAGCAVVVKPSEMTPATSQLLAELFPKYLDSSLYTIVNGAVEESTKLLSLQWDHIFYTGSGRVGRIIAAAAAKFVTPISLELGGKSPVVVDSNADFELAARRILWGKMMNSGQTCTAPDYLLIPQHAQVKLVEAFKKEWKKFYGDDARTSDSYARICAPSHWERIASLLSETNGEVVLGGETDRAEKYIAPTIVQNVAFDDSLMRELVFPHSCFQASSELFGPILAIVPVPDIKAAVDYVNSRDNPLALYIFSRDSKTREYVRENTLSGMVVENDVVLHGGSSVTPFGGVGASGYGSHKGKYSFDTFTHQRASFHSPKWIDLMMYIRFPPYTKKTLAKANSTVMPPIPYPRPGQKSSSWKSWIVLAVTFGLIAASKERLAGLLKALVKA